MTTTQTHIFTQKKEERFVFFLVSLKRKLISSLFCVANRRSSSYQRSFFFFFLETFCRCRQETYKFEILSSQWFSLYQLTFQIVDVFDIGCCRLLMFQGKKLIFSQSVFLKLMFWKWYIWSDLDLFNEKLEEHSN